MGCRMGYSFSPSLLARPLHSWVLFNWLSFIIRYFCFVLTPLRKAPGSCIHIAYFVYVVPVSSWWAWLEAFQFCLAFQRTSSWFYYFFLLFFNLLLISSLIFIISFLLLTVGFVCSSFSNYFRWQVRLFEIFLVFWGRPVSLWTSL